MPRLSKIGAAALAAFGWTSGGAGGVTASYLIVAGGGAGPNMATNSVGAGGGAGAGGLLTGTTSLSGSTTYTIVVGAGGAASAGYDTGANGSNSSAFTQTATGGGGGGTNNGTVNANGANGGSGGGAGSNGVTTSGGTGVAGQGYAGGTSTGTSSPQAAGGGGGAGGLGANGASSAGAGGIGATSSITGTSQYYAGGGGAGGNSVATSGGAGGLGGGGAGGAYGAAGTSGTANTGGGGGSAGCANSTAGSGGSGVVIVSYPAPQIFWGGFVTTSGGNIIHTFTTSGSLTPVSTTVSASYLQVAGGGSGGAGWAGGGGAGGLLTGTTTLTLASSYTVTVGAGGAGVSNGDGNSGSNSVFGALTASVGGGGGGGAAGTKNGKNGGSGGGAEEANTAGTGTAGQGYAGAAGNGGSVANASGGGGGGAGAAGSAGTTGQGGNGGVGVSSSISGTATYYAGGGGGAGGSVGAGSGGNGGGGAGNYNSIGNCAGTSGTANLGGGGGASSYNGSTYGTSGNGGSGVVIISYAGQQLFGGGVVTFVNGNTIHTFNTSGTLTPLSQLSADYLIVGGGAAGGHAAAGKSGGGGGGAGGVLTGSGLAIDTASTYLVTVGAGGAGASGDGNGNNGSNSSFSTVAFSAIGGGGGGGITGGSSGGSGGGGGNFNGSEVGGAGTAGQGNAGGNAGTINAPYYPSGGGGGAGAVGGAGSGSTAGSGGAGIASSISGTSTYYGGGGGGAVYDGGGTTGSGGAGGGGVGGWSGDNPGSGTANTGGGGGGSDNARTSGSGGSGIVIIRYAGSTQLMAGGTVTITGGYVIHTFTSSGYLAPLKYVGNSLRFRASNSAYLNRTPTVAGSQTTWTFSAWVKRGSLDSAGTYTLLNCADSGGNNRTIIDYEGTGAIAFFYFDGSTYPLALTTNALFRDPAAWYHIVVVLNTTQATSSNRASIYVNGVLQTLSSATYPSQNATTTLNSTQTHNIGRRVTYNDRFYDGELTEINFIDGQALTPNAFGSFNSYGVWQPITYGGSYGTNGFYLPFNGNQQGYTGIFNGSNQYLTLTSTSALVVPSSTAFTLECFVNFNNFTITNQYPSIITFPDGYQLYVNTSGVVAFYNSSANLVTGTISTGGWFHVAVSRNASGNLSMWINGVRTSTTTGFTSSFGGSSGTFLISSYNGTGGFVNGYVSNVRLVNGTAVYDPTQANITVPTTALTAVTNTALLTCQNATFVDNSTNAFSITNNGSATTGQTYPMSYNVLYDKGPSGNNWAQGNISYGVGSTLDIMTDVPTLTSATAANYCVSNPLAGIGCTFSNGNLAYSIPGNNGYGAQGTFVLTSGKYYFEAQYSSGNFAEIGVMPGSYAGTSTGFSPGYWMETQTGNIYHGGSIIQSATSYTSSDWCGVAFDVTNNTVQFYKNGATNGTQISMTASTTGWMPAILNGSGATSCVGIVNYGQQPWNYAPPANYVAINTYNL